MLGFGPVSDFPLSSLKSLEFYIRGVSTVLVSFVQDGAGKLDIRGASNNIVEVSSSSVGYVKITKRKKQLVAEAVRHSFYVHGSKPSSTATPTENSIRATSPSKKARV